MNYFNNPKTLTRIWAGLHCDFECVLARFMSSNGWRYAHFAALCRELQITLVLHITQGRGKTKDEHYLRFANLILQLCKNLWLRADSEEVKRGKKKSVLDLSMELKRALGGFYLLYTFYEKQPIPGRVKIAVGIKDMKALRAFETRLRELPFGKEVKFMLGCLFHKEAFHFCAYPEEYRFEAITRYFANSSKSAAVNLTRAMRDSQDVLAYSSVLAYCESSFDRLSHKKNWVGKDLIKTVNLDVLNKHMTGKSALPMFVRTISSNKFLEALTKLDNIIDKPVLTLQALTATEAAEKIIPMETRKRMERARRKVLNSQLDGDQKAKRETRPYVKEGGIFGRKKEVDDEDKSRKRERGACNGNLWIYINGYDFNDPMAQDEKLIKVAAESNLHAVKKEEVVTPAASAPAGQDDVEADIAAALDIEEMINSN